MNSLIEYMSQNLQMDVAYIRRIVSRSDLYYCDYSIPKKGGGIRHISQASPELKTLQYWLLNKVFRLIPVSNAAFAYKRGDSIKRHAIFHENAQYIFHSDINHFFPSIHSESLIHYLVQHKNILEEQGIWFEDTLSLISKICFRHDMLCIGTVSSPCISNIVMYDFDVELIHFAEENGFRYSRYADDIYISAMCRLPDSLPDTLDMILTKYGFGINRKKTWFKSKKAHRTVTGIVLTDDGRISVGSEMRNQIKAMVYKRIVHGKGSPEEILGYLSFLKDIEPNTYNKILIKYIPYCNGDVIEAIKSGPPYITKFFY